MKRFRFSVFESNSSMTHSLQIMSEEKYNAWKNGEIYFFDGTGDLPYLGDEHPKDEEFYTRNEVVNFLKLAKEKDGDLDIDPDDGEKWFFDYGFRSLSEYKEDEYYYVTEYDFESPSGDKMVAIAKYGSDC